jgi:hypothetical protein
MKNFKRLLIQNLVAKSNGQLIFDVWQPRIILFSIIGDRKPLHRETRRNILLETMLIFVREAFQSSNKHSECLVYFCGFIRFSMELHITINFYGKYTAELYESVVVRADVTPVFLTTSRNVIILLSVEIVKIIGILLQKFKLWFI